MGDERPVWGECYAAYLDGRRSGAADEIERLARLGLEDLLLELEIHRSSAGAARPVAAVEFERLKAREGEGGVCEACLDGLRCERHPT